MGNDADFFLFSDISQAWFSAEILTIREAACILGWVEPARHKDRQRLLPESAEAMLRMIERAILAGTLPYFAAWAWDDAGYDPGPVDTITPHTSLMDQTTVRVADLARWCERKGIEHPFRVQAAAETKTPARDLAAYPRELRAAIEAFEAVYADPNLLRGRSPKTALAEWLENHKAELSASARDRIAIVANWQSEGGAPKTPGK
jgi:hypothetical protein